MFANVLRLVAFPLVLLLIWTIARFLLGVSGVPYAPRGNAMFSIASVVIISGLYYGALSKKIAGLGWGGTALTGYVIGLAAQILVFTATVLTYASGNEGTSYFTHWDALNVTEGTVMPMADALKSRAFGLAIGPIFPLLAALIGRLLSPLVPAPKA